MNRRKRIKIRRETVRAKLLAADAQKSAAAPVQAPAAPESAPAASSPAPAAPAVVLPGGRALSEGQGALLRTLTDVTSLAALGLHYGVRLPASAYERIARFTEAVLLGEFGVGAPPTFTEYGERAPLDASSGPHVDGADASFTSTGDASFTSTGDASSVLDALDAPDAPAAESAPSDS